MLQSISGLAPDQVPTGETSNVTAVRSRIFHANREHGRLFSSTPRLPSCKASCVPIFTTSTSGRRPRRSSSSVASTCRRFLGRRICRKKSDDQLRRLRDIQRSVTRLRLDGGESALTDLSDLRRYIAYETTESIEQEEAGGQQRPATTSVSAVTAASRHRSRLPRWIASDSVDLPGLGEVAPDVSERIAAGLRGDVDVVLMVFRPVIGLTNVDEIDLAALQIISDAQGGIEDSRDFTWVVVNVGPDDGERAADLQSQIRRRLNKGVDDSNYTVAVADGLSSRVDAH